jgi:hypothetical protein
MDMAHGYLGDGYGTHGEVDPDRDSDRDRHWRERGERDWRGGDWRDREHDRGRMFGEWDRDRSDDDRWGDRSRHERSGREHGFGGYSEGRREFSANPDDHYRSWRDRHMGELDRDYADYCREREEQFHRDFDSWRRERHGNPQPLRTGMTQTGLSHDPTGELQLETTATPPTAPDGVDDATLGTNAGTRRGRR